MEIIGFFKALGDETRLKLANLLMRHELSVNEIVAAMRMGQSRISRHLRILTESGILKSRRDGLWVFYTAEKEGPGGRFNELFLRLAEGDGGLQQDYARMKAVLEEGSREKTRFFDSIAMDWDHIRKELFGDFDVSGEIIARLPRCAVAADLGCGTGELLPRIREKAKQVIGVDRSPKMLEEARHRLASNGRGIELRIGEIEHLPMRDREADAAVINMVLHHLPAPDAGVREAGRVLKSGGSLVIADLAKHQNEEMRKKYEHRWLGFTRKSMERWLTESGLSPAEYVQFDIRDGMKVDLYVSKKK